MEESAPPWRYKDREAFDKRPKATGNVRIIVEKKFVAFPNVYKWNYLAKAISSASIDFPQLRHFTESGLIEVFISRFKIYQNIIQRRIKGRTEILWDSNANLRSKLEKLFPATDVGNIFGRLFETKILVSTNSAQIRLEYTL